MAVLSSGHAFVILEGDGTDTYSFSFPYLDEAHIKVEVDGVSEAFTFPSASSIQITSGAVSAPSRVEIRRETARTARLVDFQDGASLTEEDLDLDSDQVFYMAQEAIDEVSKSLRIDTATNTVDFQNARGTNLDDPTAATDVMNNQSASTAVTAAQAAQAAAETAQTAAETAETNASTSATASASSATSSASSATASAASASAASTSESNASASATAAAASASAAATSESNADADATATAADRVQTGLDVASTAADVVATNADVVSTNADAATCTTKASEASTSASNAATSATAAAASASAAASSATDSATSAANTLGSDVSHKTSNFSIVNTDNGTIFLVDCTSGNVTVTLPQISTLTLNGDGAGWKCRIKKVDSSANTITINRAGTDTIEGATSKTVDKEDGWVELVAEDSQSPDEWSFYFASNATSERKIFAARVANNGTATVTTDPDSFIASVSRTGSGTVVVTFTTSFFTTNTPALLACIDEAASHGDEGCFVHTQSTSGCTVNITYSLAAYDKDFVLYAAHQN